MKKQKFSHSFQRREEKARGYQIQVEHSKKNLKKGSYYSMLMMENLS